MRELFQGGGGEGSDEEDCRAAQETEEKSLGILTDAQKKSWKELAGEELRGRSSSRARRPSN